jgi:hypothetical protein
MKTFLGIDIGDRSIHASQLAAFELTQKFFKEVGRQVSDGHVFRNVPGHRST